MDNKIGTKFIHPFIHYILKQSVEYRMTVKVSKYSTVEICEVKIHERKVHSMCSVSVLMIGLLL